MLFINFILEILARVRDSDFELLIKHHPAKFQELFNTILLKGSERFDD